MPCQIFNFFMDFVFGICVFICRKKVTIKDEVEVLLKSSLIFIILNQECFHKRLKHQLNICVSMCKLILITLLSRAATGKVPL